MSGEPENDSPKRRERPLSPHLTIYKPQITSVLSITHRATGVFLLLGAFMLVWELVAAATGGTAFECYASFATSWLAGLITVAWVFSLFFHFFNGIRHLFWDFGKGYELQTVTASGIAVLIATVVSSLVVIIVVWQKTGGWL